jgi:subtilisin family serine protease
VLTQCGQVYVIDTGVSDHSDLTGRIIRRNGANVIPGAANIDDTTDTHGHGVRCQFQTLWYFVLIAPQTRMAGIIAGQTCGVAKFANVIPVKAGTNGQIGAMEVAAGLSFAITDANGAPAVVSISIGMTRDPLLLGLIQSVRG